MPERGRTQTPAQRAAAKRNLKPIKPGEVRNPTGENGVTKARQVVADLMSDEADSLYAVLCRIARDPAEPGSVRVAAAKAALAPVLSRLTAEVHVGGEWGRSFADLVAAAAAKAEPRT